MSNHEVVMFDSDEAAHQYTMAGWLSRNGRFFAEEALARYDGCTHRSCEECGAPTPKHSPICPDDQKKKRDAKYAALPLVEWGDGPACIFDDDTFFSDEEDAIEWCEENDVDPSRVQLVACKPVMAWELEASEEYQDELPEDGEVPSEIAVAFRDLNKAIRSCKTPLCWRPVDARVDLSVRLGFEAAKTSESRP